MSRVLQSVAWWVQDYLYAAGRQLLSAVSRTSPDDFLGGTGRPVVVIPGVYEDWRFMLPLVQRLHEAGHPVHVLTLLRRNRLAVPKAADLIAGYIREQDLSDTMIVAHSKGGLIGKLVMMQLDRERRIAGMVAVCSPFSGSRYASFMLLPSLRAFSPRSSVTRQLSREERVNERITSVYGLFDPHIPEGSVLPGARNVQLDTAGHFRILAHEDTIRTILDATAGTPAVPAAEPPAGSPAAPTA
ncbi:esterase/lipase family protein [Arthrobacter sp. U41]|uniref:esterase/lipase family protein n=1 Tax=Arthrobacter sp. U41 TaxID=1849032 RepID=UPI0008594B55|nr:alpha/beta hydrolase [Arthrobacter sp. U41]AOT02467.1 alpha/beta hydrolase [Arthrobacter sp. U41]